MARKVGYGDGKEGKKTSVAERYLDEFRAKVLAAQKPVSSANWRPWLRNLFLVIWMTVWTLAILIVGPLLSAGEIDAPGILLLWCGAAVFAWIMGLKSLLRAVSGKPMRDST